MSDRLILENDELRLATAPRAGAGILGFFAKLEGGWVPLMPEAEDSSCDLDAASFNMVPYSNRIADGRFTFGGRAYQLDRGGEHAIHGDVRGRPWRVEEAAPSRARLRFISAEHENVNWPWPFDADLVYELNGRMFRTRLSLWNRGDSAMPAGLGFHPYFSRELTRGGEPVLVRYLVTGIYPDAHGTRIPSGPAGPPDAFRDYSSQKRLPAEAFFDFCGCGYDGKGGITWPESGLGLVFDCSTELGHLVFYNPDRPYFAMEPVTNANNGVNLLAQGDRTSGVVVLEPGERLSARFDLMLERL